MIKVVNIKLDDVFQLAHLLEELAGVPSDYEKMKANLEWILKNQDYILLGAWLDDQLVGTLMGITCRDLVGECKPFMVIENVVVASEHRGLGIGRQLMNSIEAIARERNCYYTMLVSGAHRQEAHRFYEAVGYPRNVVQGFKKFLS